MRVLVTGGTGFTGAHLVRRILNRGDEVVVLDNQPGLFHDELKKQGAEIHIGSITDAELVKKLCQGCEVVHHLAAAFREVNRPKSVYYDVNVNGARNMAAAALEAGVRRVVYMSTQGVHGNVDHPPGNEETPIEPEDYYQVTKYQGEEVFGGFLAKGLETVILRPMAIYGPGDPARFLMIFRRAAKGKFLMAGPGTALYQPLYIDHLMEACELAETKGRPGQAYLIGDREYVMIKDLVKAVGRALGSEVTIQHVPFWPVYGVCALVEAAYKFLPGEPPLFRRRADWFRQNRAFKIDKACAELGYDPQISLEEGLKRTGDWYRANGYL